MSSCRPRSRSLALCCVCAASQCATRCMFHIPAAVALCGTLQRTHRSTRTVSPKRYGLHSPDLRFALSDFLGFPCSVSVTRQPSYSQDSAIPASYLQVCRRDESEKCVSDGRFDGRTDGSTLNSIDTNRYSIHIAALHSLEKFQVFRVSTLLGVGTPSSGTLCTPRSHHRHAL